MSPIRHVVLRSRDARALGQFYQALLGLQPAPAPSSPTGSLTLRHPETGEILLTLLHEPGCHPAPTGAPGLFHLAFLFPGLEVWKQAVRRALDHGRDFHGSADHGVSWAIYLADPEGNGIELAWDKPADEWPWQGEPSRPDSRVKMVTRALPLRAVLSQPGTVEENPQPFGIGHLHLQTAELTPAAAFYQARLALRPTQEDYPGAIFLARGAYHHHLAVNTWNTRSSQPWPAPVPTQGLAAWEATVPGLASPTEVVDPTGALLRLVPE